MRYYPFTVAVGESQRLYVQGNFVAYYSVSAGTAAPAVEVKSGKGGHTVILKPGETVNFPDTQTELAVANYDAANTITGVLFVGEGDFMSNRIDGTVAVSLISQGATITNVAEKTVGVAEVAVAAASASRRSLRWFAPDTNTDAIYLGAAGVTVANGAVKLQPSQAWVESDGAAAAWVAISGTAGQKLRVQEIS